MDPTPKIEVIVEDVIYDFLEDKKFSDWWTGLPEGKRLDIVSGAVSRLKKVWPVWVKMIA